MNSEASATPLFRREVVAQQSAKAYGEVLLMQAPARVLATAAYAVLATCIVGMVAFGSFARSVNIAGVLTPVGGYVRVATPQSGVIIESRVSEGQVVQVGQVLFVLDAQRSSGSGSDTNQTVARLLQSRRDSLSSEGEHLRLSAQQRARAAAQRVADLRTELLHVNAQWQLQQQRVSLAQQTLHRYDELQAKGFVAAVQQQERQVELIDQQQRLADLERAQLATARQVKSAQSELSDLQLQLQREQAATERSIASLDQELAETSARSEWQIRAPQAGTVASVSVERGQSAAAGQILANIVPRDAALVAELYAPSRASGVLRAGMQVRLRYQAFPYQKYGQFVGTVSEVSGATLMADELRASGLPSQSMNGEPTYRVRVQLATQSVVAYGRTVALRPGNLLEASIGLERRRLYEWMFAPLRTLSGRL
jgi:membrane fusion protein